MKWNEADLLDSSIVDLVNTDAQAQSSVKRPFAIHSLVTQCPICCRCNKDLSNSHIPCCLQTIELEHGIQILTNKMHRESFAYGPTGGRHASLPKSCKFISSLNDLTSWCTLVVPTFRPHSLRQLSDWHLAKVAKEAPEVQYIQKLKSHDYVNISKTASLHQRHEKIV